MSKTVQLHESKSYQNFLQGFKRETTKACYVQNLGFFFEYSKAKTYDELIKKSPKDLEDLIVKWLEELKKERMPFNTVGNRLYPVRHFFIRNRVALNWPWIYQSLPEKQLTVEDRIPTRDEIQRVLDKCDERKRVCFLLLVSTGMRIGALHRLKLRNLKKIEEFGIYRVTIYAGYPEQYYTFCSQECAQAIDSYLQYRKRAGEQLGQESPLIREQFNLKNANNPKHCKYRGLNVTLDRTLLDSGIRSRGEQYKRKALMRFHSFRKYFETKLLESGCKPAIMKMLVGHSLGLEESYLRPSESEVCQEFMKAEELLTVSEEKKLRHELETREKDMEERIEAAVRKQFEKAFELARQNPTLLNVKPEELGKLKPRQSN